LESLHARRAVAAERASRAEELLEVRLPVFGARAQPGHDAGDFFGDSRLACAAESGSPVHEFDGARQGTPGHHPFSGCARAICTGSLSILERAEPVGLLELGFDVGGGD
ncbi:MAG: hypothetical protein ACK55I_34930, partial [bacterium]